MTQKLRAGILGVSGAAGQQFLAELDRHPQFEIAALYGNESAGKKLEEIKQHVKINEEFQDMRIRKPEIDKEIEIVFSALPSEPAKELEAMFAEKVPVISVSSAYRYEDDVPILIPEVNAEHVSLISIQREKRGWKGFIVPGPNCTVVPAVITLKPLTERDIGIRRVTLASYQAVSGAGIEALADLAYQTNEVLNGFQGSDDERWFAFNVIPFIKDEEEKVKKEIPKILGEFDGVRILPLNSNTTSIDAKCVRVPVKYGHCLAMFVDTYHPTNDEEVRRVFSEFNNECWKKFGGLYSSPRKTIEIMDEPDRPQPLRDVDSGNGMTTVIGSLEVNMNRVNYFALSHNLKKGAAKGAVQVAEFLLREGYL